MAIVIRITSADGKRTIMKALPGLPARIKIPAGAKVDVTENGETKSLAQYVNEHANKSSGNHDEIRVETVQNWEATEAWVSSLAGARDVDSSEISRSDGWFTTGSDEASSGPFGLDSTTLALGGIALAGAAYGVYELTSKSGTKDVTAPAAPTVLDLATDDDTGTVTTDNITNKTSGLTITGKAEAGSTVELFNGSSSLGTVTVGADGNFSKDISLADGEHSITAVAKDKAGNTSVSSAAIKVTVDSVAPAVPTALDLAAADDDGASNTDNITTKTSGLTISGKGDAGTTIELFDGTTSLGTVVVAAGGTWTKDISLTDGTHAITAKASDVAGNVSTASDVLTIKVDTSLIPTAPSGLDLAAEDDTGPSNTDNLTGKTSGLTISGNAPKNTTVELFDGNTSLGTVSVDANGHFSRDITLSGTGAHTITARATDSSGISSALSDALTITIAQAPAAPTALDLAAEDDNGSSSTDNITTHTSGLTISGNAEAGSTVELFDGTTSLGTVIAGSDGRFTKDISLSEGAHAITASATNSAGYTGATSTALTITVDNTPPAAPTALDLAAADDNGSSNSDNVTSNRSDLTISGNAEAGSVLELFDGGTSLGTVTVGSNGRFSRDIDLTVGVHEITAKATDAAGNVSAASLGLEITILANPETAATALSSEASLLHALASTDLDTSYYDSSTSFG